jgi:queuine/archaeosine tRNA-ribosyltransferase
VLGVRGGQEVNVMNAAEVYTLLQDACHLLDNEGDHAIAAYVGLAMALLADKYAIETDDGGSQTNGTHAAHKPKPVAEGGSPRA